MAGNPQQPPRSVLVLGTMTSPSGAPIAALRLAAGLAQAGWATDAAFLYDREPMGPVDHHFGVLAATPPQGPDAHLRIARALADRIARTRPDAVIGFLPLASVLGAVVARLRGVPVRIVSHRVPRHTYSRPMRVLDTLAAWTGCYTDVIAVSGSVGASCAAYPAWLRRRLSVVYNGLKGWAPSSLDKAAARAALGLGADALVVAAVGRLDRQKNYPLLIEAMAGAPPHTVLAIAGEGPLRGAIAHDIAAKGLGDRVRLLGALPRDRVPDLLAAADLFAQSSLFEGQSNALLEALHAGLPCLVGDVPEQVETVRTPGGAVAGAILPLDDAAAWSRAIAAFAGDGGRLASAREAAGEMAAQFTFARMMAGFETVLTRAIARQARAISRNRAS